MHFRFGKRDDLTPVPRTRTSRAESRAEGELSPQWRAWREAAQRVTRTWNEWSASEGHHGRTRYERYLAAVAAEERAAIRLEQALDTLGASSASAGVAVNDHPVVPSPPG